MLFFSRGEKLHVFTLHHLLLASSLDKREPARAQCDYSFITERRLSLWLLKGITSPDFFSRLRHSFEKWSRDMTWIIRGWKNVSLLKFLSVIGLLGEMFFKLRCQKELTSYFM